MELVNDFTVDVPVDEAWKTLTDVERIAPCLPGAQLQEIEGDVYRGIVKVKVGPILAQFKGQATFVEQRRRRTTSGAEGRGSRHRRQGQRLGAHHRPARARVATTHQGHGHDRPHDHRQGRPVRPGRAGRREHQAAQPVRRAARDHGPHRRHRPGPGAPSRRRRPRPQRRPTAEAADRLARRGERRAGRAQDRARQRASPST